MKDTIAAVATAPGEGAVAIVRMSGEQAIDIAGRLCRKDFSETGGYTVHYATVYEGNEPVDEVLVTLFRAPKSFTAENMTEISCHGGIYITKKILSLCIGEGARIALPGEFTERAYLNGRIDLPQAEGVNEMIRAADAVNARSAVHSLKGSIARLISPLEEELIQMISQIEVNIDYPEYDDVHQLSDEEILPEAKKWLVQIDELIRRASQAVQIRRGINTVILGKPNVGKSSLLNALLEEDKAIVTDVAGTTRDLVEGSVKVGDITLNLIDTAGIRKSSDPIEEMGIERSLKALEKAELIIVVMDSSSDMDENDRQLLDLTAGRNRIVVYNKKDRREVEGTVAISAANHDIQNLIDAIQTKYAEPMKAAVSDTLNNERQIGLAIQARNSMNEVIKALEKGVELDLVTIDLQNAYSAIKEITGQATREGMLDEIFRRFCLGK